MRKGHIIILVLSALMFLSGAAFGHGYSFQTIEAPDNISRDFSCISISNRSYVWCGTADGLCRMGYYENRIYPFGDGEGEISGSRIYAIHSDKRGFVWIATDAGLLVYDSVNDVFRHVNMNDGGVKQPVIARCILETSEGVLYFGGSDTIFRYYGGDRIAVSRKLGLGPDFVVEKLFEGTDGRILVFNRSEGFMEFFPRTGVLEQPERAYAGSTACLLDSKHRFWTSQYNRGLNCYDSSLELVASYDKNNSSFVSNIVTCLIERQGKIWAGTDGGGISIIDPETGTVSTLVRSPEDFNSITCSSVRDMALAPDGSVWVLEPDGSIVIVRETAMRSVAVAPVFNPRGLCSDEVLCIYQEKKDADIWIGTANSGLYSFKPDGHGSVPTFKGHPATSGHRVVSVARLSGNRLLLSYFAEGLFIYHTDTDTVEPFRTASTVLDDDIRYGNQPVQVSNTPDGKILILSEHVYLYDPSSGRIGEVEKPFPSVDEQIYPVAGSDGLYYYDRRHLFKWNRESGQLESAYRIPYADMVNCVSIGGDGLIWFATSNGIAYLDTGNDDYREIVTMQLSSASSILCDKAGRIWVGSEDSLYGYLKNESGFIKLNETDGMSWNNYSGTAVLESENGMLLMGGSNGLTIIDPDASFRTTDIPDIIVADILLDGERISEKEAQKISARRVALDVNFFVQEDNVMRRKDFRFTIVGPDKVTEIVKDTPSLNFKNLKPGRYTVSAGCTTQVGGWSEEVELLRFRILPLWYRTNAFRILLLILAFLSVLLIHRSLTKKRRDAFEKEERELRIKADEEKVKFLLNVSHELKTPLTLIMGPVSRLLSSKGADDPEYKVLTEISRQANRMKTLILTVLDAHKIEEGSAKFNGETMDYNAWIDKLSTDFIEEANARSIEVVKNFDPAVGEVTIDCYKLENVVSNLFINAIRHSRENTVITVGTRLMEDGMVRSFVSDQGDGLQGVDMSKLFSRYYQGIAEKTGSGMGLAYSNTIVALHKGKMGARDNEDAGATFYFDIPVTPTQS